MTVVGAGNVGATCAQVLATRDYADLVLVDIKEGLPQGKALDINQMGAVLGYEPNVTGSNGYEESAGSDVVVITAGLPRSPGMSRDDLVATNEKIVKDVTEKVIAQSPDAILIVVSNPLDAMCHVAKSVSGWPKERVFGMAGILDTARFSTFIAWETDASVKDVQAMVLGGHGDQMVPVVSATTVGGVPLRKLVAEARIQAMVERTAKGGGELVNLMGTSAWYAPGAAAAQMVDSIMLDEKRVLPAPPTSRASTGSTASTWACRASSARRASSRSSSSTSPTTSRRRCKRAPKPCAKSSAYSRRRSARSARHRRQPPGGHRLRDHPTAGGGRRSVFTHGWTPHDACSLGRRPDVRTFDRSGLCRGRRSGARRRCRARDARPARRARRQSRTERPRRLDELTAEHLDAFLHENVRASLLLVKEFAAQFEGTSGRVVLITSGAHIGPMAREVAYAVSKGALAIATATLAEELAPSGITVNCVNPGPTDTGWGLAEVDPAGVMPLGRWGEPDDAARLVAWLCSDDARLDHRPGDRLRGRLSPLLP